MPFNILLDEYPNSVVIDEVEYSINSNFKLILEIIRLLNNDLYTNNEKVKFALCLFYSEQLPSVQEKAYDEMLKFIHMYKEGKETKLKGKKEPRLLDYDIDSGSIYSAFLQQYNIDLTEETMHWFKFLTLLENLSDGNPKLMRIMEIRGMEIDNDMDQKQRAKLRKLKKEYSLEDTNEVVSNIADAFFFGVGGGVKRE
ncbi:Gp15 family bacteriophage protein [Anaerorhabdus sp.]|uniref:Gp15 family bacteriophage protein n=1 Tax=Anaerorhabdus sp. TaxID=1872524 RepID=UPI002FC80682